MAIEPHAKIINAVAKQVLAPLGFFQRGRSRTWLQDNGWFLTVVEFQPSGFTKGTYVNVAMHFLWNHLPSSDAPTISFDYGWKRLKPPIVPSEFIEYYGNDEAFAQQVETMARAATKYAENYRRCTNLVYARKLICAGEMVDVGWIEYDRAMLCLLMGDVADGLRRLEYFAQTHQGTQWYLMSALWKKCEIEIPELCRTDGAAREMVMDMIQETRAKYRSHPSYQGMNAAPYCAEAAMKDSI